MANKPLRIAYLADVESAKRGLADLAQVARGQFGTIETASRKLVEELGKTSRGFAALDTAMKASAVAQGAWIDKVGAAVNLISRHRTALLGLGVAAAAYFATVHALATRTQDRLEEYLAVAEKARRAGVGAEFAQAFPKIAGDGMDSEKDLKALERGLQSARDAFRETVDGASTLSKLLDEIAENGGFTPDALAAKSGLAGASHEERLKIVLGLVDNLMMQGQRLEGLNILEKAFGSAEAADVLIRRMDETGKSLSELYSAAANAPELVRAEEARRAEELKKRLDDAHEAIRTGLLPIVEDLAKATLSLKEEWAAVMGAIGKTAQAVGGLYTQMKALFSLSPSAAVVTPAQRQAANVFGAVAQKDYDTYLKHLGPAHPATLDAQRRMDEARRRTADLDYIDRKFNEDRTSREPRTPDLVDKINPTGAPHPPPPPRPLSGLDHTVKPAKGGGGRAAKETVDATERQIEALEKSIRLAQVELETIGKTNAEKEKALALAKADGDATDAQKQKLAALGEQYGALKDRIEAVKKAHDEFVDQMNEFGSGLSDAFKAAILDGKSLTEVMHNLSKSLAGKAIDRLFNMFFGGGSVKDGGILGALLGSSLGIPGFGGGSSGLAFGGPRAEGGPVSPGNAYWVGERGPELVTFDRPGMVHPAGSGALNVVINDRVGADFRVRQDRGGVTIEAVERVVSARIAANNRMLPGVLADAQRRM